MPYCVMDFAFRKGCETWCYFIHVSLYIIGCGRWSTSFVQLSPCLYWMHTDWQILFHPPLPLFFLSLLNEVSTLLMFFLLILLTWCVTPHCSSLRGYLRFTPVLNLPCQCVHVDMCLCDCVPPSPASFLLIKRESFAVFACPMAHTLELSFPGKSSQRTDGLF